MPAVMIMLVIKFAKKAVLGMLFMLSINSRGLKILPCGTPNFMICVMIPSTYEQGLLSHSVRNF